VAADLPFDVRGFTHAPSLDFCRGVSLIFPSFSFLSCLFVEVAPSILSLFHFGRQGENLEPVRRPSRFFRSARSLIHVLPIGPEALSFQLLLCSQASWGSGSLFFSFPPFAAADIPVGTHPGPAIVSRLCEPIHVSPPKTSAFSFCSVPSLPRPSLFPFFKSPRRAPHKMRLAT